MSTCEIFSVGNEMGRDMGWEMGGDRSNFHWWNDDNLLRQAIPVQVHKTAGHTLQRCWWTLTVWPHWGSQGNSKRPYAVLYMESKSPRICHQTKVKRRSLRRAYLYGSSPEALSQAFDKWINGWGNSSSSYTTLFNISIIWQLKATKSVVVKQW